MPNQSKAFAAPRRSVATPGTAYLKTEAIQAAIFGFVFLSDHLTVLKVVAILIATVGVVIDADGFFGDPTVSGDAALARCALSAIKGARLDRRPDQHRHRLP